MKQNYKYNILIADDHEIFLECLSAMVHEQTDINVLSRLRNGREVMACLKDKKPDLIVMDLNMPVLNGLECMELLNKHYPEQKAMILTVHQEAFVIRQLIKLGVKGIMFKNSSFEDLLTAIRTICAGEKYFDKGLEEEESIKGEEVVKLTPQEIKIIKLVADGLSSVAIADELHISEHTVNTHKKNINYKLNIHNAAQLVAFAKSSGIIH